jgi:4-diphosphocytidyl-2-C-methyl-D-erythritol kinase
MSALRGSPAAKLNLALAVTGRRDDGYHTLRSIFVRTALHDDLDVEPRDDPRSADSLVVVGDLDAATEDNIVLRAAAHLRGIVGRPLPGLHFSLTKRIPEAAGLAGGSSDAATAMELAARLWDVSLHPTQRQQAALHLGADVPFFVAGQAAALVEGIGDRLRPLAAPSNPAGFVLVTPAQRLSTAAVFSELDRDPPAVTVAADAVEALALALQGGIDGATLADMAQVLAGANDLWGPANRLSPGLGDTRDALTVALQRPVLLTGSGSTLFAIYPSTEAAVDAAARLERERPAEIASAVINATSTVTGDDQ